MEGWKSIQKVYRKREILGLIAIAISFMIGAICDWNVLIEKNVLIPIDDIESFSLTILQIQATVGTLIFTIIALITGNISDSYMGVSVNDFYLNIKPWKLTQKVLIIISLGICLVSIVCHSLGLYNIVFYLFVATLIVILISILQIYPAFEGKNKLEQDIESYIIYMLEKDISYEKKLDIFCNFVSDWEKIIYLQEKVNYEKYLKIFEKCMSSFWDYGSDEALVSIKQQCYSVSYCLLNSEKKILKRRGIEILQYIYDYMWIFILNSINDNRITLNKYKSEFPLFKEIYQELMQSIGELNIEDVEKSFRFDYLIDSVLRVDTWLKYDKEENLNEKENTKFKIYQNEIESFAKYMGYYLSEKNNKKDVINSYIWAKALNGLSFFSTYNIPKEREKIFLWDKVNIYFSYCYSMIINKQETIIKQGLYIDGMGTVFSLDNKYQALLYLSVHCYIYYIAEREKDECVPEDIRKSVSDIWNDDAVKVAFKNFIDELSEKEEWLNLDMYNQMCSILDKYELYPKYGATKCMLIKYVVSDFYLFLILYMSYEFLLPGLLEKNIDDAQAYRYILHTNEKKTKDMLVGLFKMASIDNKTEEEIYNEVNLIYDDFEKKVKKKQKERYIKLAKEEQKKYESQINEKEICEKIKNDTIKNLKEKFAPILVNDDEKNGIITINLLKMTDYTKSVGSIKGLYSHINEMFLYGIVKFLYQRKEVEIKNKTNDFENDKEFIKYLAGNSLHLLLGSQYIFKNRDYKIADSYEKFMENSETIYTTGSILRKGIALKKNSVQVCLHNVNVSIHPSNIKEENVKYDIETENYSYSILEGVSIDFSEEELREFLYNNFKIINITAKISVQVNERPCGTIFIRR